MTGGRKEAKPFILKAGFALILSLAGFLAARHRPRRRAISPPPLPLHHSGFEPEPASSAGVLVHQTEESLTMTSPVTMEDDHYSSYECLGKEEEFTGFLLPELSENFEINDSVAMEEEIKNLRNLVQSLQDRENCLEMKLLEYHGLKEQEVSMGELHNRLKISATETKLLSLKIESLKSENKKLRAETSENSRAVSELEMQRKFVAEQAKEMISALHGRITELRENENKYLEDSVEVKLFNKLENDVIELGKENSRLSQEKLAIIKKLDYVLKISELGRLEEQNQLREENENLNKKLEQLQTDRCQDVEELVYLRWINACLRYELRNYQPPPGRTLARDLSRCLSPKSEQKAKQLILDYSNSHLNSNRSSLMDLDLDDCFSQTSSEEFDEISLDSSKTKSSKSSKSKLVSKIKKLVLPKSRNEDKMVMSSVRRDSVSTGVECYGNEKWKIKRNHSHDPSRSSLDIQNLRRLNHEEINGGMPERCNSDIGAVYAHKRMLSLDENSTYSSSAENEEGGDPEKEKLKKFAQVFKDSQRSLKSKRRPASLSIA